MPWFEPRRQAVEHIIEDLAWANSRRMQLDAEEHDPQETLDEFREYLCGKLAYYSDEEMPKTHEKAWTLIYEYWANFIYYKFHITQSWEEYKQTDDYKNHLESCKNI